MKVLLDANVILSAVLFPKSAIAGLVKKTAALHTLVLSDTVIDEIKGVVKDKFPAKSNDLTALLAALVYEYQIIPANIIDKYDIQISDPDDKHVLASALFSQAAVLVTGDKHFFERKYDEIEILRPSDYLKKYCV